MGFGDRNDVAPMVGAGFGTHAKHHAGFLHLRSVELGAGSGCGDVNALAGETADAHMVALDLHRGGAVGR